MCVCIYFFVHVSEGQTHPFVLHCVCEKQLFYIYSTHIYTHHVHQ